jgi:hypothetical protein
MNVKSAQVRATRPAHAIERPTWRTRFAVVGVAGAVVLTGGAVAEQASARADEPSMSCGETLAQAGKEAGWFFAEGLLYMGSSGGAMTLAAMAPAALAPVAWPIVTGGIVIGGAAYLYEAANLPSDMKQATEGGGC